MIKRRISQPTSRLLSFPPLFHHLVMFLNPLRTSLLSRPITTTPVRLMSTSSSLRSPIGILSPKELHSLLSSESSSPTTDKKEDVIVLDSSWFMPNLDPPRFGFKEFRTKRIENAGFWDL